MADSTIPEAIDALLERVTDVADGVQVIDGPLPPGSVVHPEHIDIGVSEELGGPAVTGTQTWGTLGGERRNETFDIFGRISVTRPDENQKAARDRVFEIFGPIAADLRATSDLVAQGSRLLPVEVTALELDQTLPTNDVETPSGAVETRVIGRRARLTFVVRCKHRI